MAEYKYVCVVCGKEYFAKHPSPNNKYCSRECSRKGYNAILAKRKEEMEYKHRVPTDEELVWAMANRDKLNDLMNIVEQLEGITNRGDITLSQTKNLIARAMSKLAEIDDENDVADNYNEEARIFFENFISHSIWELIDPIYTYKHRSRGIEEGFVAYTELLEDEDGNKWSSYKEDISDGYYSYPLKDGRKRGIYELWSRGRFFPITKFTFDLQCSNSQCAYCQSFRTISGYDYSFCVAKLFNKIPYKLEGKERVVGLYKNKLFSSEKEALQVIGGCEHHRNMIDIARKYQAITYQFVRAIDSIVLDRYTKKALYELYAHHNINRGQLKSAYRKIRDLCTITIQKQFIENHPKLYVAQKEFADKYGYFFKE